MEIKKKYSIFGLYLILFFLFQNNFYLTNKLSVELGEGIGSFRSKILIIFIILGIILLLYKSVFNNFFLNKKLEKYPLYLFIFIIFILTFRIIFDLLVYSRIDLIGLSPIIEGISFLIFFNFFTNDEINISRKQLLLLFFIIFTNSFLEIFFYLKDTLSGIQYGPFKANISGFTINRNPSFFYPIFCLVIIKFAELKSYIKLLYITIFTILIFTLFYRTLYLALIIPLIFDWLIFNSKIYIKKFNKLIILFLFLLLLILVFDSYFKTNYNFSFIETFTGRFSTTFTSDDLAATDSRNQRIDQVPEMLIYIIKNPLGIGFNGLVLDSEIYNYAYYIFHPLLYLGWSIFILYFYLFFLLYKYFNKDSIQYRIIIHFIIYYFAILILFPYMTYFTFTSVFMLFFMLIKKKVIIN
jgi:hypothetical protein